MPLTTQQCEIVFYSLLGPAALSILATLVMIIIYLTQPQLRKSTFKLVFVLAVFDLFNAISFAIPTFNVSTSSWNCQAQAFLFNFSSIGAVTWSTFIAIYLYSALVKSYIFGKKGVSIAIITTTFLSFSSSLINFEMETFGKTESLCWIKEKYTYNRIGLFFIPLWVIVVLNSFIYTKLRFKLSCCRVEEPILQKVNRKLKFYPLVLVACYLVYSVKVGLQTFGIYKYELEFSALAAVCRCLHGFINFIVYGLTNSVRKIFKRKARSALSNELVYYK